MKKYAVFLILSGFVLVSSSAYAQRYALGADVAVKVEYFRFMDSNFEHADAQDGVFIGFEAYKQICLPNLYLGIETGWGGTSGEFRRSDFEVDYVPIEFNAKYVFEISPCWSFDLGAGVSYNYISLEREVWRGTLSTDDWLFGGQFFADLNYHFAPNFYLGIGAKYQLTDEMSVFGVNTDTSADNLRLGAQLGYKF